MTLRIQEKCEDTCDIGMIMQEYVNLLSAICVI